jgi:cyanate permease
LLAGQIITVSRDLQVDEDAAITARDGFRWVVLAGVWLIYATFGMIVVSLAPLVPYIMADLAIGHTMMGAIFGAWQLVFIFAAIPSGALMDRIGVRRGILLGTLAIALSALMRGLATNELMMLLAVALFGAGGPIISTGAPKVVAQWFRGTERGLAMGIYITGPAVGGILALSLTNSVLMPLFEQDWRAVQWLWAGCAVVAGLAWIGLAMHPRMREADKIALKATQDSQMRVVGELIRLPVVQILLLMSIGIFTFNHGLNNWLPEILRAKNMSPVAAGYWATIPTIIGIAGSLLIPRLATPERRCAVLIGLCLSAILATVLLRAEIGIVLALGLVLQGIARSSLMTVAILTLIETPRIGEARAATASGMFFSAAEVGGAGGPLMLGFIHAASGGFQTGMTFLTIVTCFLLAGAVWLRVVTHERTT